MPSIEVATESIHFTDHGGAGPVLFFHHGFFMDEEMFAAQVTEFASEYRIVTIDARGHGGSSDGNTPFGYDDLADDAVAVLDHLDIPDAIWVGMSQGGFSALRAARRYPSRVASLVLIGSEAESPSEEKIAGYQELFGVWRDYGPVPQLLDGLAGQLIGSPGHWPSWQEKWAKTPWSRLKNAASALMERDDFTAQLAALSQPTLVICGSNDRSLTAEQQSAFVAKLPHGQGPVMIDGAAHAANLTHSAPVNAAIRQFLAGCMEAAAS